MGQLLFGAVIGLGSSSVAARPTEPIEEVSDTADVVGGLKKKQARQLLVVPIPQSSPTLGTGVTLVGVLFYNPNGSKEPWLTGIGAMRTSNKSWGLAFAHKMYLDEDRFRLLAFAGYGDVNLKFYGIGPAAGDRGLAIDVDDKGVAGLLQGQMRIAGDLYAGPRFKYLDLSSRIRNPDPRFPATEIPSFELKSRLSALGLAVTYDHRDSAFYPRDGELLSAAWMFGLKALGSDFSHDRFTLAGNIYRSMGRNSVLAVRAALCGVSRGGPFYDLCLYGQSNDLRGYETGRYRDRASWAIQAELRQQLFGRFAAVAFAGAGGVASSLSNLDDAKFLPAGGLGLRYQASKANKLNLRLDYAVGKDSRALYFSIGEAF